MTDRRSDVSSQEALDRGWFTQRRRALLAVAIATAMVVVAVWLGVALAGSESELDGRSTSPSEKAADPDLLPGRRYGDKELGIDELIDAEITPFEARYRDLAEWEVPYDERQRYLENDAVGYERERMFFERNVEWLLSNEYEELPADLGRGGILDRAFEDAMDRCAEDAGWPELELNVSSTADVGVALGTFGLTRDDFLDLRHECAKQAAAYPTLDPVVRDDLLGRLREHYRQAVYEYLREFPDAEVPLVDHPGAPRPLEDRLIMTCLKEPDPAACAERFRVELPGE